MIGYKVCATNLKSGELESASFHANMIGHNITYRIGEKITLPEGYDPMLIFDNKQDALNFAGGKKVFEAEYKPSLIPPESFLYYTHFRNQRHFIVPHGSVSAEEITLIREIK